MKNNFAKPCLLWLCLCSFIASNLCLPRRAHADFQARDAAMLSVAVIDLGLIFAVIWSATRPKKAVGENEAAPVAVLATATTGGFLTQDDPRHELFEKYSDLQVDQPNFLRGLRPYSYEQVRKGSETVGAENNLFVEELRQRLQKEMSMTAVFGADQQFNFDLAVHAGYQLSDSPSTPVLEALAITNPLLDGTEGRFYQDGSNAWLEPQINFGWRASDFFAVDLVATPSLTLSSEETAYQDDVDTDFRRAYMLLHFNNLLLEAGRDSLHWGVGRLGNLLFSGNSKPLNLIRLRNDLPVEMPSLLRWMGPTIVEGFYTQLDGAQTFADAHLLGSKVAFNPLTDLELGFAYTVQFGGQGAPSNNPLLILGDSLTDVTAGTNRNFIFECRYRWRDLNIEPYVELLVEDCCDEVPLNPRDVMNLVGLYLPNVDGLGKLDMTLEWVRTNQITYRHGIFDSGYVYRNRVQGHTVGPDAMGFYAQMRYWFNDSFWLTSMGALETRGRRGLTLSDAPITVLVPTYEVPESRYRWTLQGDLRVGDLFGGRDGSSWLRLEAGYEWVEGFNFIAGSGQPHLLAGMSLQTLF